MRKILLLVTAIAAPWTPVTGVAGPLTTLLGLAAAEQVAKDHDPAAPTGWREQLQPGQKALIEGMRHHPGINACIQAANDHNPVATYHLRKIAEYSWAFRRALHQGQAVSTVEHTDYQRPGKALRWCSQQAGVARPSRSLQDYARGITRLAARINISEHMTALQSK